MSAIEFKLRRLLEDATFFINNAVEDETYHEKSKNCLDEADSIVLNNTRESYMQISAETLVSLTEVSLLSGKRNETAERVLNIFFQRITQEDQFYCRALLARATIEERKILKKNLKGDANLKQVLYAFSFVQKAIEISTRAENKQKYQFIVYNASIKTWHILRGIMRPGWSKFIIEVLEKISNLLEEADDSDFNWRCRYMNALCKSLTDAENKKPESLKILDKLVDLTKKKGECNFQEALFRTRMHMYRDNNGVLGNIKKETETGEDVNGFKPLYMIQFIKSGMVPEAQIEKELQMLMSAISPASVSDDPTIAQKASKISPIMQDRIAECGRLAIKYGLINFAEGACNTVARARQGSLRAKVWTEYTKAELLLKKPSSDIDPKTGMKLNTLQRQIEDFERRVEALKILDRAMIANKRLNDAEVTIEGCILIWNIGIPFLKNSARSHIYKPFLSAAQALETLEANETQLRVCLLLELAKYEIEQDFLTKATLQLKKALMIDYSTVMKQMPFEITADDNPEDFARPYDRVLKFLLKKLNLKTNLYGGEPDSVTDQIILDVENAKTTKNAKMRQTLLDKAVKLLQEFEEPEFEVRPEDNLVEEEIQAAQKKFHLQTVRERKERVLICAEIAKLALEENIIDLCFDAATLCVQEKWDPLKDSDLVIAQSGAHIALAKCYVEYLLEEEIEIGTEQLTTIDEDQEERQWTAEEKAKFEKHKSLFLTHCIQGVQLGTQTKQSWLVFNSSIEFWNNYLPVFKMPVFYDKLHSGATKAMQEMFEAMNGCFLSANFSADHVDYELNKKMLVFSNLSVLLARIFEYKANNQEAVRICDILLQKQLPSHLRKTFDSIKARVTKQVAKSAEPTKKEAPKGGKGQAEVTKEVSGPNKTDILTAEVLSYLELIANGQKDLIQKALDVMNTWHPNEQEEIELELNVELWCRLGRLAISQKTNPMQKIALYCADVAIKNGDEKARKRNYKKIPVTRLRWYAVAEALYGEALYVLLDRQKQEKESQDKLLHASVARFVESCQIASIAGIPHLVLESAKSMWNSVICILDAPNNRKMLIKPLADVHTYLKDVSENTDPDFLTLIYSALFQCITEQRDWKLGEKITEEAFTYIPQTHQKVLWEAKMNFLSKLGKNVLSAIANMKESNASLMAKVWVRLARSSNNMLEQHSAYNKAIEILRKEESIEVVEVLIEYAEWMHRNNYAAQDVEDQLLLAVDMMMDIEPGWDDEDDEIQEGANDDAKTKKTGNSRSSRNSKAMSKAQTKKSIKKSVAGKSKVSKATMRTKSIRSKQSKASKKTTTALQKRQEEDGQPSYLNCSHFDKLIRIHSMLAMIAPNAQKQKELALDAHFFLMKMWEQSFQTLNAVSFMESHGAELAELGYNITDQASRREFFMEIFTGNDMQVPSEFTIPEKPEDWISCELPDKFFQLTPLHEDKIMVAKFTFVKPELTFMHLKKVAQLLEQYSFTMQLIPVLRMIEVFAQEVIEVPIEKQTAQLQRARVLFNLGVKDMGQKVVDSVDKNAYNLTEEERRIQYEKIKELKDPKDSLGADLSCLPFEKEFALDPLVVESVKMHEQWLGLAEELLRWGEFVRAKTLAKEANLHARILKDQDVFAHSLHLLGQIQYLEGDSAGALRTAMVGHQYAKDICLVEQMIVNTFNLLFEFDKLDDCQRLIDPSIKMFTQIIADKKKGQVSEQLKNKSTSNVYESERNPILPLEFAYSTTLILKAILNLRQSNQNQLSLAESDTLLELSFQWVEKFESHIRDFGYKQLHLELLLRYTKLLYERILGIVIQNMESVTIAKKCLTQCAAYLIKTQDYLKGQVYYIGVHQDSAVQSNVSLPLLRLLSIAKLRLAQVNTTIGVVKNTMKTGSATTNDEKKKMARVVQTFLDAVTKQIDSASNTYKKNINRYEKSIAMLFSALNLIHHNCEEHVEILVEIARNRRLLAVNKKHLRGQWRQDALIVDQVNMNINQGTDAVSDAERKDALEQYGLQGEVQDRLVDYKQEMIKSFIDMIESKGEDDPRPCFERLVKQIANCSTENLLSSFAVEFAEARANLNKEQAFFYLALFQYSISRKQLLDLYLHSMKEQHPDTRRRRAITKIKQTFAEYTTPFFPKQFVDNVRELETDSKPLQILSDYSTIEQFKEGLPGQSGYLVMQISKDKQSLYIGYCQVQKDRKFNYFIDKMQLTFEKREELESMVRELSQLKISMMKTPITIQEDIQALEKESEAALTTIIQRMEKFFEPVCQMINKYINPEHIKVEDVDAVAPKGTAGAKKPAEEAKKAPPPKQAAPAKGGAKPGAGGEIQLAAYESSLPLSTGGVESIVLLADQIFETLPLECLSVFKNVPVVSRDFNLHLHMNRLKTVGHKSELHNNQGINKEELRYIVDLPAIPSLQDDGTKLVKDQLPKLLPNSKMDGILTHATHIPSDGEWQKEISNASLFAYYSMTCLLHKFPAALISNLAIFNKCKAMVIFDRMNSLKTLVDRNVLTSQHFSPDDQPMQQAALFSLCGVASITVNHWSVKPEDHLKQFSTIMKGSLQDGLYFGTAALKLAERRNADLAAQPRVEESKEAARNPGTTTALSQNKANQKGPKPSEVVEETVDRDWERHSYRCNIVNIGVPFLRVV